MDDERLRKPQTSSKLQELTGQSLDEILNSVQVPAEKRLPPDYEQDAGKDLEKPIMKPYLWWYVTNRFGEFFTRVQAGHESLPSIYDQYFNSIFLGKNEFQRDLADADPDAWNRLRQIPDRLQQAISKQIDALRDHAAVKSMVDELVFSFSRSRRSASQEQLRKQLTVLIRELISQPETIEKIATADQYPNLVSEVFTPDQILRIEALREGLQHKNIVKALVAKVLRREVKYQPAETQLAAKNDEMSVRKTKNGGVVSPDTQMEMPAWSESVGFENRATLYEAANAISARQEQLARIQSLPDSPEAIFRQGLTESPVLHLKASVWNELQKAVLRAPNPEMISSDLWKETKAKIVGYFRWVTADFNPNLTGKDVLKHLDESILNLDRELRDYFLVKDPQKYAEIEKLKDSLIRMKAEQEGLEQGVRESMLARLSRLTEKLDEIANPTGLDGEIKSGKQT